MAAPSANSNQGPNSWSESVSDSKPVEIDDEDAVQIVEEKIDGAKCGSKRKLTSPVWNEFSRIMVRGVVKTKCMHCSKYLSGDNGTKHLHDHLKICTLKKIKMAGNKSLSQTSLRFGSSKSGQFQLKIIHLIKRQLEKNFVQ
jgi:hypothetical protein